MANYSTEGGGGLGEIPMGNVARGPFYFDEKCSEARSFLKVWGKKVLELKEHIVFTEPAVEGQDRGEMTANIMLAYRHMEDAAMRLGKAIQAFDGGKSAYDK